MVPAALKAMAAGATSGGAVVSVATAPVAGSTVRMAPLPGVATYSSPPSPGARVSAAGPGMQAAEPTPSAAALALALQLAPAAGAPQPPPAMVVTAPVASFTARISPVQASLT
jgi:hypothetical protein